MSDNYLPPSELISETDPQVLSQMLNRYSEEQTLLETEGFVADSTLSDEQNAERKQQFDMKLASLIEKQIGIIFKLRKTATGPAKAGGKRAKKAPADLAALDAAIFGT